VFGKLFTKNINDRLNKWTDNYYVIVDTQASLMSKKGTVGNVLLY